MGHAETRPTLLERLHDARDDAAWREFDERYRDLILSHCRRRGLEAWDAEDVRQIVMTKLFHALTHGFAYRPDRGRFRDYLARAVRNAVAANAARRGAPVGPAAGGDDGATDGPADPCDPHADAAWEREWQDHHLRVARAAVQDAIEPRDRAIFDRLYAGQPTERVAADLGVTTDVVRKVKQRVLARLRERVAWQIREENGLRV